MDEATPKPEEKSEQKPESAESAQESSPAREQAQDKAQERARDVPLPPPTFEFLVLSLRSQAEIQLGLLHLGEEKDRPKPNLPLARHTIDLMAMLQRKTKGNLSVEESRLLENSLTELRFRYVQASEGGAQD